MMAQLSKCKFCGQVHRLGQCPELQTKSRDGVERHAGKERAPTRTSVELPPPISRSTLPAPVGRSAKGSLVSSPARATKPAKKAKPKGKTNGKNKVRDRGRENRGDGHNRNQGRPGRKRKDDPNGDRKQPAASRATGLQRASDRPDDTLKSGVQSGATVASSTSQIKVGPPRKGEEHKTLTATKPWEKLGMSRAKWYRIGKSAPEEKR